MSYQSIIETKGVAATTYEETLKSAAFDWEPLEDQVVGVKCGLVMPRKKMIYRSDNLTPLGVVGEDYVPSQPREFLKSQYLLAEQLGGKVVRAGWTERRSKAFACVRLEENIQFPKGVRAKGDPVGVFVYSTDGWDGSTPRASKLYMERLACTNGMITKELASSLWVPHTSGVEERYTGAWKLFQAAVTKHVTEVREQFVQLAKARLSDSDMRAFVGKLIEGEGAAAVTRREQIFNLFHNGIGLEGKTKWDALNAVTEYVTHHAVYRETKIASAATSRFLGVLGRNPMNEKALHLLLA
jgi:hypothetical protein